MRQQDKLLKKSFRYRIYPTAEQKAELAKVFGCCRYVYNWLLVDTQDKYKKYLENPNKIIKPNISAYELSIRLTKLKHISDKPWLNDISRMALSKSVHNLADAYKKFFNKTAGYPKFKKKNSKQSATFPAGRYDIRNNKLKLEKFDSLIKVKWSRELPRYKLGELTVTMSPTGKYYVSISCSYLPKQTNGQGIVGIDAGITDLATISNGSVIANPKHYLKQQHKLARAQRTLSRKKKGSNNRKKAKLKVAKIYEKITNCRISYLHKLTSRLISENQAICIETLRVSNMVKNKHLAKHILDASWGTMRDFLKYKAVASQHCVLFLANPYFPSTNLCSNCSKKPSKKLKLSERGWKCEHCGSEHNRDHNAAINLEILARSELKKLEALNERPSIVLVKAYIDYGFLIAHK